ncbi:MAG: hypothetical protein A2528_03765 [Candidatus Staskawiczbacteria bacterium RIFOXYD2_FULL_37_9]|uniref:Uncharacterized protein n=1 Tax=Candidatus Staskawiczbacteria bacterium RIFOXYB1_FULL_37_44 TaxID=1802223 RepID=A0A1G2IX25_9BACT|nr:MAG: hypothetical protein A2358_00310 [Candidatus Staskawiczbacteria bacterium RIFOXYB1_FULL_37_44]OGZ83679.1 MAG: hypothetical protein A2416_03700 [Candidatus Staskawiczbacteria bacterium RIFOXYC1_FULL_37_52]OGZ88491.1 MAG: hypothetical protein A2444_02675 [Candidatus Staskawiczbacteria bacterium RIFOXYC2_FULL_37_19]OGZ90203.1 MAG: hypothetical protein A2581_02230 [Candidatus Staskawiczbacteria bacterium RIFOXYD1_FULL_37_110]OGZ94852.1 MAG: hypothetical protein A2528_03765 [Candidatus Stask
MSIAVEGLEIATQEKTVKPLDKAIITDKNIYMFWSRIQNEMFRLRSEGKELLLVLSEVTAASCENSAMD